MRLALKITWIVMVSMAIGLAVQAKVRLDRELDLIESEMRRDQRLLGRALIPLLEASYLAGGEAAFDRTIAAAFESEREIELQVRPTTELDAETVEALARSGEVVVSSTTEAPRLTTYLRLPLYNAGEMALELSEPLTAKQTFSTVAFREFLVLLAWLLAATTIIGATAGYWVVGRRVGKLVRSARAVSRGQYSPWDEGGWDEIAMLSRELSSMTRQLQEAEEIAGREAERRGELQQQLRHADRLATVGAMASRVAHDVGTPLNVIAARSKMIARAEVDGAEARKNAEVVAEQSDRIAEKVRELLDFSRRQTGPRKRVGLRSLLTETSKLLESLARSQRVRLEVVQAKDVHVQAVALQLQQALVNLVVNAIHAAPPDSAVTISADSVQVDDPPAHAAGAGRFARIRVSDAGDGIPAEVRGSIFEAFFTTKAAGHGTGLGLPIASGIVRDHGGFLRLDETVETGATVELFIPENSDA